MSFQRAFLCVVLVVAGWSRAAADVQPHAGMLRFPDVSATHVVFAYADDLWLVPRAGGMAVPLASPPGEETAPRFSPDGRTVAFVGAYGGARDIYTLPVTGGVPQRLTYHPDDEVLCDWTPDGRLLFSADGYFDLARQSHLLTVSAEGGQPERLPVPYGVFGAISADGQWLAYTPSTRDWSTWKRYRGGLASDIWLFNLRDLSARRVTDWEGTDTQPMWQGTKLYYLSDGGPEHRLNIWVYDTVGGQREQVTRFEEFDVKWPAIGPGPAGAGEIVFQNGAALYLLDLPTRQARTVAVTVPGDRPTLRPKMVDVRGRIEGASLSARGKRVAIEARGDIWTLPAHRGAPRNLTRTSGVAERDPAWSPDGRWIAYLSDQTGEYELYVAQSDGKGETRQLTRDGQTYRYLRGWSPDSKHIVFTDKTGALYLATADTGATKRIALDPAADQSQVSWSHDSQWIAYTLTDENRQSALWLYHVSTEAQQRLTSGMFQDSWPTFDRAGKYFYFLSNRHFDEPVNEDLGQGFAFTGTELLLMVPLQADRRLPWAPRSDEESWEEQPAASQPAASEPTATGPAAATATAPASPAEESDATGDEEEDASDEGDEQEDESPKPVVIDAAGFESRAVALPIKPGSFSQLAVNAEGHLLYVRHPAAGPEGEPAVKILDLKDKEDEADDERKEETVLEGVGYFDLSADGKKLLAGQGDTYAVVDAKPGQNLEKPISLEGLTATIDPRAEWQQLFNEAWRIERDFFYVANMHGVDWPALRAHYGKMLADCVSRGDVGFVIRELISELNIGHAYYFGSDDGAGGGPAVGLLGADFELHDGAYRIKALYTGGPWDLDARGPLGQPGMNVHVGEYVLAVNRVPVDARRDIWAAFEGLAGRTVTLTISDKPALDDTARELLVRPQDVGAEQMLRYRAWVERNRARVHEQSGGRVGYIHVPDTASDGRRELFRQFYGQRYKAALIIDERWNGGGWLPHPLIELLNRPCTNYWANRDGWPDRSPPDAHFGPKCMLINGSAGSGGDMFPYLFRQAGLGKLVGTRTWGGLVGIGGNPALIDGTVITAPRFAFYELDGTWGIEGHGVDPDIEVVDDPALMVNGGDPQLDAAIKLMLTEIETHPHIPPPVPPPPDRHGMGIREEDK